MTLVESPESRLKAAITLAWVTVVTLVTFLRGTEHIVCAALARAADIALARCSVVTPLASARVHGL